MPTGDQNTSHLVSWLCLQRKCTDNQTHMKFLMKLVIQKYSVVQQSEKIKIPGSGRGAVL